MHILVYKKFVCINMAEWVKNICLKLLNSKHIDAHPCVIKIILATFFSGSSRTIGFPQNPGWPRLSANSRVPANSTARPRPIGPIVSLKQLRHRKRIKSPARDRPESSSLSSLCNLFRLFPAEIILPSLLHVSLPAADGRVHVNMLFRIRTFLNF